MDFETHTTSAPHHPLPLIISLADFETHIPPPLHYKPSRFGNVEGGLPPPFVLSPPSLPRVYHKGYLV